MNSYWLSITLVAFLQAGLAGEWHGDLQRSTANGALTNVQKYEFVFNVDGTRLTGTIRYRDLTFAIGEGEITGSKVRFFQMQMDTTGTLRRSALFEGELQGDDLILIYSQPGAPATGFNGAPRQPPPPVKFVVKRKK
jgi:hypothetical protein